MRVQPTTDLAQFVGRRVVIDHGIRRAIISDINHGTKYPDAKTLHGGFCGMCVEDPHGDCRGGATAFWWPYDTDLTIETA